MFHSAHIDGSHERPEAVEPAGQQWLPGANDGPTLSRAINHRHQINVAYSNLDDTFIPNEAATSSGHQEPMPRRTQTDQISVKYAFTNERHRRSVENLEVAASTASDVPSTEGLVPLEDDASITSSVANGDNVSSRGTIFSEAHLDPKAKHAIDFSNTVANSSPSRRSEEGRTGSTSELQIGDAVLAVINNVKVSNSVQPISNGASAEHSTTELTELKGHDEGDPNMLDTREGKVLDKASEQRSLSPEHPPSRRVKEDVAKEGAITPTHSSATSDGVRGASFILLDDSVYIAHDTQDHRRNGSSAGAHLPPAGTDLTLDSRIFAGRNFDEQIIFLNGPDLLETSVEQESSSSPTPELHGAPRRQMGKVARDVSRLYEEDVEEPLALPLRPIVRDPADAELAGEDNVVVLYADQREPVRLNCEVDADITTSVWLKDGQIVHAMDKKSRTADVRFVRESFGGLTIQSVMLEDDGVWQCEAENARGFFFNGRPIKLIVLDPPKEPYLLIDSRRLDAGNMFIPVKENAELTLACVSEGGNPKPTLSWEVLLSPGIDRHAQKLPNDVLELQELKKDKDKEPYRINSGAVSEAKLPGVFRVHHNARILCIMEHPTLKVRQNASILLDVQYTPSFAITRTPGFGYPLREGIEVSLKCDVDSNPPSTPLWQKDDGDTPVPQIGDGFLNFSSIRREHSGWYKCTSRHLNFQYSSIGYYLSVRYEPVDVTSEPVEQDLSMSSSSSSSSASSSSTFSASSASSSSVSNGVGSVKNSPPFGPFPVGSPIGSFKPGGQMEVELGGSVTLQCPQGTSACDGNTTRKTCGN
ncbi:AGAP011095-PA-like protein [Anopheles sinensis]|uniref:AGAP011095-PA-like protein n=1 Tax=Anopheles sinensis TaxID=74873 RepID=A0A084W8E5_ANOSI|nr:AGAP011095-PA-like protein [Anopheles sinensis]